MIRRSSTVLVGLLVPALAWGCGGGGEPAPPDPPGLLVLVVVDQLRADLLDRYGESLTGGFARLVERGASYPGTRAMHGVTNSAPGHTTLATGAYPSTHGIVDNGFWRRWDGGWAYVPAPLDTAARILGLPESRGYSARPRLVGAIGDWAIGADPAAEAISIGQGAHSSNMLAAHGGEAYWFSAEWGGYVTSSYYRDAYPGWVEAFNRRTMPALLADSSWELTVPRAVRGLAVRDDAPWEVRGGNGAFPHGFEADVAADRRSEPGALAGWFEGSPGIDRATLALARAAVDSLGLGRDGAVDVLTLNLSSLDEVGHRYGPFSLEQLDALLRLDRELGSFMAFLDDRVGAGRWALALSADHGAATPPAQALEEGVAALSVPRAAVDSAYARIRARLADADSTARFAIAEEELEALPFIAEVYAIAELGADAGTSADPFIALYRNSFHPDRRIDFPIYDATRETTPMALGIGAIRMTEHAMMDYATSIHGSPYPHDREVPFFLLGPGVEPGERAGVETVDVAPSLAHLGGVPVPGWVDGESVVAGG